MGYPCRVRFAVRIVAWIAILVIDVAAFTVGMGRLGIVVGAAFALLSTLWMWFWLPGSAHRAFERGLLDRAARRYRYLGALAFTPARERAALLSRAGCHVAARRTELASQLLARIDPARLDAAERAVWLNNRACAQLDAGTDAHAALALAEEATALRPDVPAVQHTRGMALLAVGRIDDAITVLDGMRAGGELSPRLEAERCRDLAAAWERKGQAAYAEDYRMRAAALSR
jgi:predicted Zn-dependent protease